MTIEIRPIREEELEEFAFINAYSFNSDRRPEALQQAVAFARATFRPEWTLGLFSHGQMAAGMRVFPFATRINGRVVPMGGVASVACLPEHRRQGRVGALLKRALSDMRERGQVLAGLYTPHPALYRRFGWESASTALRFGFEPKDVRLVRAARAGRSRRVTADDWPLLNAVYEEHVRERNGPLVRVELWWREGVFGGQREPFDAAVWESAGGECLGYVVYRTNRRELPNRKMPYALLWVRELVALSGDAYLGLLAYLLSHDVHDRIEWLSSLEEPLLQVVDDPWQVDVEARPELMLRLVDLPAALAARPCDEQAEGKRLTVAVRDSAAPWNAGTWDLSVTGGAMTVEASMREPDLTLDVRTLAAVYNGHVKASAAARTGLIEVGRREAPAEADAVFSVRHPPFCMDWF